MATSDETNNRTLPSFSVLKGHERAAVVLKSEGKTVEQIVANINDEFALTYTVRGVGEWFQAGGRLEQALIEYNEALAVASLRDARQLIKRASRSAAATLIKGLNNPDPRVANDAAKSLLNKYIPDRQVISDSMTEEELPEELANAGDALLKEREPNGPDTVDDARKGGTTDPAAGSAGSEDVPPSVLSESAAANDSSNPPA